MSWVPILSAVTGLPMPLIAAAGGLYSNVGGSVRNEGGSSKNEGSSSSDEGGSSSDEDSSSSDEGGASKKKGGSRKKVVQYVTDPALVEALEKAQSKNARLAKKLNKVAHEMEKAKIASFKDLRKHDRRAAEELVNLAREVEPMQMPGIQVGLFGQTSTGKSTVINAMLGKKDDDPTRADTGYGETTRTIHGYDGNGYRLVDVPGRNDDLTYFTADYISFWKGLSHRLVLVEATLKEMTKVMRLLDEINLKYDIVVNKFDLVKPNEADSFKQQIKREIRKCKLKGVNRIFFISAENPKTFDWVALCDYITTKNK